MISCSELSDSPKTAVPSLHEPNVIVDGLYVLMNKTSRLVMDLAGGSSVIGTKCSAYRHQYGENWVNTVWLVRRADNDGSYIFTQIKAGTVLDLTGRQRDIQVNGYVYGHGNTCQTWEVREEAGLYTTQSDYSKQYLGVRSMQEGAPVVCSSFDAGDEQRLWEFERMSRTAEEITNIMAKWDESLSRRLSFPYTSHAQYFVLPSLLRQTVWENQTGLLGQRLRKHVFDYDDFVIRMKNSATSWALDNLKIDGYSVLFGIIFGNGDRGPSAYNWYLSSDMQSLVLFDAQSGREFTTPALEQAGFTPSFGIF